MVDPVHEVHAANRRTLVARALEAPEVVNLDLLPVCDDPLERVIVRAFAVIVGASR